MTLTGPDGTVSSPSYPFLKTSYHYLHQELGWDSFPALKSLMPPPCHFQSLRFSLHSPERLFHAMFIFKYLPLSFLFREYPTLYICLLPLRSLALCRHSQLLNSYPLITFLTGRLYHVLPSARHDFHFLRMPKNTQLF